MKAVSAAAKETRGGEETPAKRDKFERCFERPFYVCHSFGSEIFKNAFKARDSPTQSVGRQSKSHASVRGTSGALGDLRNLRTSSLKYMILMKFIRGFSNSKKSKLEDHCCFVSVCRY